MRDYGKVYSTFWSSATTGGMSEDAKLLALYLMSCSHSTIAGVFRLPDGYVSEDLGWDSERVTKGFAELFDKGFANRCVTTKWVWIRKHLEWNKPENPNQRKSASKIALSVPDNCDWKQAFMRDCSEVLAIAWAGNANPSATVAEPFLNQKQEQEQEQEQESKGAIAPSSPAPLTTLAGVLVLTGDEPRSLSPPCPVKQLVGMFIERCVPPLPKPRIEMWKDSKGAEAMRQRWKWLLSADAVRDDGTRYASNAGEAIEWFGRFFDTVKESDFLMGRTGGRGFDLTWLMNRENFTKVVQGNYENRVTA